ncbi:MAG: arginine-tRNA-protein transferase [Candidatus Kapaibacterium sp.]|nr:MAG: arginine-tRNA-protein transferase [Candidatus Kapabacteria bacterium]
MNTRDWYEERWRDDNIDGQLYDSFYCSRATPAMMDAFWADGWRHFGTYFFRTHIDLLDNVPMHIRSMRIRVRDFAPSKAQRRILRKNNDVRVEFQPIRLTEAHEVLFEKHKQRFTSNQPLNLHDFLSQEPAITPCLAYECRVSNTDNKLLAVSFLDVGENALSSVYAMFDTDEAARGLGNFTLLAELEFARHSGKEFLYMGYVHEEHSFYDYKKHFAASEYYDWRGTWLPFDAHDETYERIE